LRVTLVTDQDPLRGAVAQMIAEQLADIGMQAIVSQESDLIGEFLAPRTYQAAVFGLDTGPDPDPYPSWHSSQAQDNGRNIAGYRNDEADQLMESARQTFDTEERKGLYGQFATRFLEDAASVPLYSHLYTYFLEDTISNVNLGLLFWTSSRFASLTEWENRQGEQNPPLPGDE
jgi:peptide/nickel transport system substrate-binding protein